MEDITQQKIIRSFSVRDNRSVERAISRRVAWQHEAASVAGSSTPVATDAVSSLAMANDAMTEKYRARILQRKQQAAGVDKQTMAIPTLPSSSTKFNAPPSTQLPPAVLRSQSVTGVLPRSESLSDFDGRLVDELRDPLRKAKCGLHVRLKRPCDALTAVRCRRRLDAIRAFVTEQQQFGVATQARASRLIQKLTELLGVELVMRNTLRCVA